MKRGKCSFLALTGIASLLAVLFAFPGVGKAAG